MKKLLLSLSVLAASACAQEFKLGAPVADFELHRSARATPVKYRALKGDTTVVIFVGTACPISNGYNDRMKARLQRLCSPRACISSSSTPTAPSRPAEVQKHAESHGFPFPVYKDPNDAVADRFGAQVTPETFVMDSAGVIRYHGYVDDSRERGPRAQPGPAHGAGCRAGRQARASARRPRRSDAPSSAAAGRIVSPPPALVHGAGRGVCRAAPPDAAVDEAGYRETDRGAARQDRAGRFLGHLVRPLPRGTSQAGGAGSQAARARLRPDHHLRRRARAGRRRLRPPAEERRAPARLSQAGRERSEFHQLHRSRLVAARCRRCSSTTATGRR